ncbi:MAG: VWA domain-containing protein [Pseudomonadota bacterium]
MRILVTSAFLGTLASAAVAQDQPNTILVLDGSGSMWGQIDGTAKITIAQEVVGGILADFPAEQGLGLTVYGHRERGNCTDIETIVAPAPGTVSEIVTAVNGIKPLGKTPMTDAVIAAAQALRYTEDSATVILVSDGVETCNPDPCAAARLLEEAGINFTTHVVGFDVSDPEALAQMQCLAEETGGQFLTASNADELDLAMTAMVMEPTPEPIPEPALVSMTFTAVIGEDKAVIDTPILWDINDGSGLIVEDAQANPFTYDLPEGAYTATAYSIAGEETGEAQFVAITGGATAVEVMFEEKLPTARIIAPASAAVGDTIQVGWAGPALPDDYVGIGKPDAEGNLRWENFFYVADGNPSDLLMPTAPGDYLIKYYLGEDRTAIVEVPISLTPVTATIDAPAEAVVGEDITVTWTGPAYDGDYIGIGLPDAVGNARWENFFYLDEGSPQQLTIPTEVGEYEISYFFGQNRSVLTTTRIAVSEVGATITAPAEAEAGSAISVTWTGPDFDGDYIGIGLPDATGNARWENFFYTEDGSPAQLTVPTEPGDYIIQYFLGQDRSVLATIPFTATEVGATITAPAEAEAGSDISVAWTGPDYDGDYIGIGKPDAIGNARWDNFFYTEDGSPSNLTVPTEPGDYIIQYFLGQDRAVLTTVPFTATEVGATLTLPPEAVAGSTISVGWTGPGYEDDYIGIGAMDATASAQWDNFFYVEDNTPGDLLVPMQPGEYLVQYFLGQDRAILVSETLTVTPVKVEITAPATAVGGDTIAVSFDGPDYDGDYIGIGVVGATGNAQWEGFAYTDNGSPADVLVPTAAGDYLIKYFSGQDRSVLQTVPITVTPIEARLIAPDSAPAGSDLIVGWDGPDYQGDYIGIGPVGAERSAMWEAFDYTRDGNPLTITLPEAPGDYLIQYFVGQDRSSVASRALTIE